MKNMFCHGIPARMVLGGLVALAALSGCTPRGAENQTAEPSAASGPRWVEIRLGAVRQTLPFQGTLEARNVMQIAAGLQGSAVLEELAAEGVRVQTGDVLARFDTSQIEQDLARQENECVRARQELESLEKAELPLELLELDSKRAEAAAILEAEEAFLVAAKDLEKRGLMTATEVRQQKSKLVALREQADRMDTRIRLTRDHVHTARLAKAKSALAAAERQRNFTAQQLALCVIRAPVDGVVSLVPLPVGGEYRPAHVGDTLFRNQIFMCLPKDRESVIRGYAEEASLPFIQPSASVVATPAAYPDLQLTGHVESVGAMAHTRPGLPLWRKFFPVVIALDPLPQDLPAGLSMHAEITAGEASGKPLVPRVALEARDGRFYARKRSAGTPATAGADEATELVEVRMGWVDSEWAEVRSGLTAGDLVQCP